MQKKIGTKAVEIAVPLKYWSNFGRNLDMPLINCEVSLTLTWSTNCVITSMEKRGATPAQGNNLAVFDNSPTNETFKITQNCMYQQLLYQLKMIINY